jgi:hypothetical protein
MSSTSSGLSNVDEFWVRAARIALSPAPVTLTMDCGSRPDSV